MVSRMFEWLLWHYYAVTRVSELFQSCCKEVTSVLLCSCKSVSVIAMVFLVVARTLLCNCC